MIDVHIGGPTIWVAFGPFFGLYITATPVDAGCGGSDLVKGDRLDNNLGLNRPNYQATASTASVCMGCHDELPKGQIQSRKLGNTENPSWPDRNDTPSPTLHHCSTSHMFANIHEQFVLCMIQSIIYAYTIGVQCRGCFFKARGREGGGHSPTGGTPISVGEEVWESTFWGQFLGSNLFGALCRK